MDFLQVLRMVSEGLMIFVSIYYWYQLGYLILPHLLRGKAHKPEKLHGYAVLIAARNEQQVLPHLLRSIQEQTYPAELITTYVVADNCTDDTARVARELGANVLVRTDPVHIGKGYALHALLEHIRQLGRWEEYDCFLVFDADNLLAPDYVEKMNRTRCDGYEAFCGYRNSKNFGTNWLTSGYSLMFLHDCVNMNRSRMLLGSSCIVSGTGFGCTRQVLERCGYWNFFTLTEDTQFSYWCAANGVRVGYCHDAMVYDEQPVRFGQSWRQRVRWVQGSFQVAGKCGPSLLRGLLHGSYACYECLTMSLWGYGLAAVSAVLNLVVIGLKHGILDVLSAMGSSLASIYISVFVIGLLTELTQWKRIRATTGQKLAALVTFPVFLMTFIPIAIAAPFTKFQWKPIEHKVAVSAQTLLEQ